MASAGERVVQGCEALTDKEKQTLRLIVRGHDAKSTARELGLSVHTINERLRDARRKLSVSSSREAARVLLEREGPVPELSADKLLREATPVEAVKSAPQPDALAKTKMRFVWGLAGVVSMSFLLGLLAVASLPQSGPAPGAPSAERPAQASALEAEVVRAAREWLALVDAGRWAESWRGTSDSFRELNTVEVWADASEKARGPLGPVRSRTHLTHNSVPAPPAGVEVLRFRTDFAKKPDVVETVSLARENGAWKVVGIYLD